MIWFFYYFARIFFPCWSFSYVCGSHLFLYRCMIENITCNVNQSITLVVRTLFLGNFDWHNFIFKLLASFPSMEDEIPTSFRQWICSVVMYHVNLILNICINIERQQNYFFRYFIYIWAQIAIFWHAPQAVVVSTFICWFCLCSKLDF